MNARGCLVAGRAFKAFPDPARGSQWNYHCTKNLTTKLDFLSHAPTRLLESAMPQKKKTRVVIVDDHPLFRQGLKQAIEGDERLELSGEAGDAEAALDLILALKPDVIVLD